jgi:hypothetical protein
MLGDMDFRKTRLDHLRKSTFRKSPKTVDMTETKAEYKRKMISA